MEFLRKIGWLNLLLVFVPIAIILKYSGSPQTYVFGASALAIIPLAGLMGRGTEVLADRLGPGIGGLLNASFGNAAELIIALFALHKGLIGVVKASITGSIIGNILLVMGASLFAGGMRYKRQTFNVTAAGMSATLLALAAIGLLVPAIFHASVIVDAQSAAQRGLEFPADAHEQELSLEIAVVLFSVYILTLLFSLKTHKHLYDDESTDEAADIPPPVVHSGPHWSPKVALGVLLGATSVVALMSEILVGAIEETSRQLGWSEMFVGVIVVAIVGNAAEHSTAILVAMKNRMGLSIQIAVGSALQIAMFVAPLLVFVSYLPGFSELDLRFSMLEVVAIAVSVMIVGLVAYDGESNWLEGLLLLAVYVILGIAFYHLPEAKEAKEAVETSALPAGLSGILGRIG
jgi:Ca2+:H+ antiporter